MAVVEQNNQIRELESKERNEIDRIIREFSARVGESADLLLDDYDMILFLDLAFAKSKLADNMRATVPNLIERGETRLMKARHPLIDRDKIVPIDIYIGGDFSTLVVTGPNTGGKTVALKTLGLLTLMAMCGLMLPVADDSAVCFYGKVLADIGDEQSIEQSLSTFSGHMTNIVSILTEADGDALILIDELGAGTDPVEGAALAVAILTELKNRVAKIAATTHYAEIKMYALQTEGVENASCEFDVATLRPTYRLLIGVPGRSNAFAISERLGLPVDIIEAAKEQVSHENARFEDVVSGLEETRQQLEREKAEAAHYRQEAERAKKEAENIQQTLESRIETEMAAARDKARGLVERMKFQSENLLHELEELKRQKDKADFSSTVGDIRKTFGSYVRDMEDAADPVVRKKQPVYRLPRKLKRGDRVMVAEFNAEGTCLQDQDDSGYMQVQTGILKTKVKISSLRLIDEKKRVTMDGGGISTKSAVASAKADTRWEIDLRGMDSGEDLMTLDQYLDSAILSGYKSVSIIHGKGTGVLRTAVQNRLRKHKSVKTFRIGAYGEGDAGVTIAELK
jgi:DNA mismatch repair protein MutS2